MALSFDPQLAGRITELKKQRDQELAIRQFKRDNGLLYYRPHAKQHAFHICKATGRYGQTGNRFGKSEMGTAEDVSYAHGERPFYKKPFDVIDGKGNVVYQHPGGDNHPYVTQGIPQRPVKGLVLAVDWDKTEEIFTGQGGEYDTWGKMFKLIPNGALGEIKKNRQGYVSSIAIKRPTERGGGESIINFGTIQAWKNNELKGESGDWDFIHVDEPVPEPMFKGYSRGLADRNGRYWFTCTPLNEMWINDRFTPSGTITKDFADGLLFGNRYIITGSIYDNPYRSEAGVEEFKSGLTREEIECRLYGIPLEQAGCVYKEFIYDQHVLQEVPVGWTNFHQPPNNYTIRQFWDFHTRLPQAVLFFATDPHGRVYCYDELWEENLIQPVAKLIKRKSEGYFVADRKIDPFALISDPIDNSTIVDKLLDFDLYFEAASKDLRLGINETRILLKERGPSKIPNILFSPNCIRTIWEFSHYTYNLKTNEPEDKNNHMMENLYRAVLNGLGYIEPPTRDDLEHHRDMTIPHDADLKGSFGKELDFSS